MTDQYKKRALLVGVDSYRDPRFPALPSCVVDTWQLNELLSLPQIGGFMSVERATDTTAVGLRRHITAFLDRIESDELALLYLSGHGQRLVRTNGEFVFVASDTDPERAHLTGVPASFINERLEACRAAQRIAIVDACMSGGFALGFRTRDDEQAASKGTAPPARTTTPFQPRGVYVLSSSGPVEPSYAGERGATGTRPSVFTGEIIEALRTGHADTDGDGVVSVGELFHHVAKRMRDRRLPSPQIPVLSSIGVNGEAVLTNAPVGPAIRVGAPAAAAPPPAPGSTTAPTGAPAAATASWPALIDYYQRCLLAENVKTPLFDQGGPTDEYVILAGSERLMSGALGVSGSLEVRPDWRELVDRTDDDAVELWTGYPVVLLTGPPEGRPWPRPRFAPAAIRRVALVEGDGQPRLEPFGPVQLHPRLAALLLGDADAEEQLRAFAPTWRAGLYGDMVRDLTHLVTKVLGLPCVQELDPERLDPHLDARTPTDGARNVALLFTANRETGATGPLLKDLGLIAGRPDQIQRTALDLLLRDAPPEPGRQADPGPVAAVLRANEAQLDIIRRAMTRRLTVATGPPGTGKSQLVVNAVATALCRGDRVLVASTNNRAVDEVVERCERLVPGAVVRTGSRAPVNYRQQEQASLQKLLSAGPPGTTVETARAAVADATARLDELTGALAGQARQEADQLRSGRSRHALAAVLGTGPAALVAELTGTGGLGWWRVRAARVAKARLLGTWRRRRLVRRLAAGIPPSPEACRALADLAATELAWQAGLTRLESAPDDAAIAAGIDERHRLLATSSVRLTTAKVLAAARNGRAAINQLLQVTAGGDKDWAPLLKVLDHVRGWAVTTRSARRFPLQPGLFDLVIVDEAGQCSVPDVIPLLFRAKRALVIGDPLQLGHITTLEAAAEARLRKDAGLPADVLEERQLAYRRHSAFHAADRAAAGSRLLDEHYRCHPVIAEISNRHFYGGDLTVLTDVRALRRMERDAVVWVPVAGRAARQAGGGSWVNHDEAVKVHECVRFLLEQLPADGTVGVVTPFTAQMALLESEWTDEPRVKVGTVHRFQGGERDAMVFSLVAGAGMSPGSVSWLERQRYLWNVAITRAKSHLVVVGDQELWQRRDGFAATLLAVAHGGGADDDPAGVDDLVQRLYTQERDAHGTEPQLGAVIDGYRVDALTGDRAVLLDRGTAGQDPAAAARHLRIQVQRLSLLTDPDRGRTAVRLPAWRLFGDPPATR